LWKAASQEKQKRKTVLMSMLLNLLLASGAATIAIPATRKFILGDIKRDWLADQLELETIEPDGITIRTKSGLRTRIVKIKGVNYDAKVINAQGQLLQGRSDIIHQLGNFGIALRFHAIKRPRDISYEAEWPCKSLQEIGDAEQKRFRRSFTIDWYIQVTGSGNTHLDEGMEKLFANLEEYEPRYLETSETGPCEITGFLNGLVSGEFKDDLPAVTKSISGNLPASDLHIGRDSGVITTQTPDTHYQKVIAVRLWPEGCDGIAQHQILSLPAEIEITQICLPIGNTKARALLARKQKELEAEIFGISLGDDEAAGENALLLQLLSDAKNTLFETQYQIIVRSLERKHLDKMVRAICGVLGRHRIIFNVETVGAPTCWFNRIAGNNRLLRPLKMLNKPIAALWPFHHAAVGRTSSPYGEKPVRLLTTPSGQTYAAQFHVKDKPQALGNYMVFAPAGSGKSTLIMHLLSGLAKFVDVPAYVFDSNEGARFMIEAMGGVYQGYEELALNPLDVGADSLKNRQRLDFILKAMIGDLREEGMEDTLHHLLDLAFKIDTPDRTFNEIFEYAFPRRTELKKRFATWVTDSKGKKGLHSHVFNAPHDSLSSILTKSHLIGINMNEALKDDVLGPPVVAHISEAIRAAGRKKRGFNIFIDEAANLLQNEGFKGFVQEMFREYRKLDGAVGLAFQDPEALERSGIARAALENTATLFFFPNANANPQSLAPFNLNDEQMDFVMGGAASKGGRRVLIIQRDAADGINESGIVDVDLSPLGDSLRFYRAGTDANNHLQKLQTQWGAEWPNHL
jgi:type IV secretion system protein VirB4